MSVQGRTMLLVLLLAACALSAAPLRVLVSVAPQLESVRRIGGDLVQVEALTPPGSSPETYVLNVILTWPSSILEPGCNCER